MTAAQKSACFTRHRDFEIAAQSRSDMEAARTVQQPTNELNLIQQLFVRARIQQRGGIRRIRHFQF